MYEFDDEYSQNEAIQYLVDEGEIDHPVSTAIAQCVISRGVNSLKGGQRDVYERYIAPKLDLMCPRCGTAIPTEEIIGAYENKGRCSWCIKMESNDD